MTRTAERHGYWVVQWSGNFDPSLEDLLIVAPDLVLHKRVAVAACDGGPYTPSATELAAGWSLAGNVAVSGEVTAPLDLPTPGFDEWYVFDAFPGSVPTRLHVNRYNFSVVDASDEAKSFWEQVVKAQPLHVLGAGMPNMFLVTRDLQTFELAKDLDLSAADADLAEVAEKRRGGPSVKVNLDDL